MQDLLHRSIRKFCFKLLDTSSERDNLLLKFVTFCLECMILGDNLLLLLKLRVRVRVRVGLGLR